jgi:hypothetical protein
MQRGEFERARLDGHHGRRRFIFSGCGRSTARFDERNDTQSGNQDDTAARNYMFSIHLEEWL